MKNKVNKIIGIGAGAISFVVIGFIGFIIAGVILLMIFGGAGNPDITPEAIEFSSTVITIVSMLIGFGVGAVGGLFVYYRCRERGYADSQVKVSHRDW